MKLYHGNESKIATLHIGLCMTPDVYRAEEYGRKVTSLELDESGLIVESIERGYDRDTNEAIGDDAASIAELVAQGVDVVVYEDESPYNRSHTTYRIISQKALAALRVVELLNDESEDWE